MDRSLIKTLYIYPMISNDETALQLARYLLQIKAIKIQINNPFQWASGWLSPIYCDNRKILSHPNIRFFVKSKLTQLIQNQYPNVDNIAGVATGAIAIAALVAEEMKLPMVYVRSSSKGHGLGNQVEGDLSQGQKVVVIEDLISTGMSSLNAVKCLKSCDKEVLGMTSIFNYGFDVATKNFEQEQCKLYSLSNYQTLIKAAVEDGYIKKDEIASLENWRINPEKWRAS